jgi:hypothetical protein
VGICLSLNTGWTAKCFAVSRPHPVPSLHHVVFIFFLVLFVFLYTETSFVAD